VFSSTRARQIGLAGIVAGLLTVAGQIPAAADGATVVRTELSAAATVPCALGGIGEDVLVDGTALLVIFQTTDASGGTHFVLRANYDSLVGAGLTSGTIYHAVATEGTSSYDFDPFVGPPYSFTNTRHVRFVGQGPDNDFSITETVHVTVNAEGEVTAEYSSFQIDCG
jgi:hypothetical protein